MTPNNQAWLLADKKINSRLLIGSALYPSPDIMRQAIQASGSQVVTVSIRRQNPGDQSGQAFGRLSSHWVVIFCQIPPVVEMPKKR